MHLTKKGGFSYKDDVVSFVKLKTDLTAKIERVNDVIARLSFVDDLYVEVPVPVDVGMVQENGEINPVHFDGFFITNFGHYTLYLDDIVCLELTDEKRQGIRAPSSAAFWSIE